MKNALKPVVVLALISSIAAVLLSFVNMQTEQRIADYEKGVLLNALENVSGGYEIGERFDVEDEENISYGYTLSEKGAVKGYLLGLETKGYGGRIELVAGFLSDGSVLNAAVVSDSETPGVGKKAENPEYMEKFRGKGTSDNPVPKTKKDLTEIDAASVSGATMTFTGVTKALSAGSAFVLKLGERK